MSCDRKLLSQYCDGELSPQARRQVDAHVAACAECRAVLRQYQSLGNALRSLGNQPVPAGLGDRFYARVRARPRTLASRLAGLLYRPDTGRPLMLGAVGTVAAALALALGLNLLPIRPAERLVVVAANPPNGATDVVLDEPIEVEFSEPVDLGAVELAVRVEPAVPVESSLEGKKLIVRPKEPLQPDTKYAVRIEAKKPAAQTAPAAPPVTLNFSTGRAVVAAHSPTAMARPAVPAAAPSSTPTVPPAATIAAVVPATLTPAAPATPTAGPNATARPTQSVGVAAISSPPAGSTPCGTGPSQRLAQVFLQRPEVTRRLGCALAPERGLAIIEQSFEGGAMFGLSDRHEIEVLFSNGRRASYQDTYQPGASPSPTRAVSPSPVRGFGKLWQERPEVRGTLGAPAGPELSRWAYLQTFGRGLLLSTDANWVYVLYDDGTWQKLPNAPPAGSPTVTPTTTATATQGRPAPTAAPSPLATTPSPTATPAPSPTSAGSSPTATSSPSPPLAGSSPTPTPSATATSALIPTEGPPSTRTVTPTTEATPTLSATPTPSVTPTPTPDAPPTTPTPGPVARASSPTRVSRSSDLSLCEVAAVRGFGLACATRPDLGSRLGCPIAPERAIQAAHQYFEGGYVYWRADVRQVYVLYDDSTWAAFSDTWREGDPDKPGETPPNGRLEPVRGVGRVWQEGVGVRARLGWALTPERAFSGAAQPFERGLMLWSGSRRIYVLYPNGTWQGFPDEYREAAQ